MRAVEDARTACEERRWGDAWRRYSTVVDDELDVDDLDRFATAAYLTGHDEEGVTLWVSAHQRCAAGGAVHRAASFGAKLAESFGFRGDLGRCRGWVERTGRLLDEGGIECVEQGYLDYGLGMLALFETGDVAGAHARFVAAGKVGRRFAHRELVTLARIGEGRMLVYLGDVAEGMGLLDEAMAAIEAGDLSELATGDAYCTVIDACAELFDVGRCRAWTESFVRWCDAQQELVIYRGHCFLHRAEVLGLLGSWPDALGEARRACDRLAHPVMPTVLGAACNLEGDLLRLLGDLAEAELAYGRASALGHDPEPGLALLRSAQGHGDAADAMIRRALGEHGDPLTRARLLPAAVEILLDAGDVDAARAAASELVGVAADLGTSLLLARAARAMGAVVLASGEPTGALVELRSAFERFHELGVRYEAARSRLLIAEACTALGDLDSAAMERAAAGTVLSSLAGDDRSAIATDSGLTPRELEVLRLVARGMSNRAIAHALVVSQKTVASHVSHIFTKTGVTSRSAATAYAYDHRLV